MRWPPSYRVRMSSRAKRIGMRILPSGLELVVPQGMNLTKAEKFLQQNRAWVEKHLPESLFEPQPEVDFPSVIEFAFLNSVWPTVFYRQANKRIKLMSQFDTLVFTGNFTHFSDCLPVLKRWLKKMAEQTIIPHLDQLSRSSGLSYADVTFRYQKTLWGSCSCQKKLNLNTKLLFFPEKQVHYVLLHELCHTRFFDHSRDFWNLLESLMPDARKIDRSLNKLNHYIPDFLSVY